MSVTAEDGTETALHFLRSGELGGEGSLLKSELRRYDLVAAQPSRVCLLPQATFDLLHAQSLPFNHFLIGNFNERMGVVTARLEASRLLRPEDRVAQCLRLLATREGSTPSTNLQMFAACPGSAPIRLFRRCARTPSSTLTATPSAFGTRRFPPGIEAARLTSPLLRGMCPQYPLNESLSHLAKP